MGYLSFPGHWKGLVLKHVEGPRREVFYGFNRRVEKSGLHAGLIRVGIGTL